MIRATRIADRIGGGVMILTGLLSLREAYRLYPYRLTEAAGDHSVPALLGIALVILGGCLLSGWKAEWTPADARQDSKTGRIMLLCGILLVYAGVMPYLGYSISTFLAGIGLFFIFGHGGLLFSLLASAAVTASLYVLFVVCMHVTLPAGYAGF